MVRLVDDEIRTLREKMLGAFDLACRRFCLDRSGEEELSDRRRESLEGLRIDAIDGLWCDGGNPGSVMLDRRDDGHYCLMAWDLDREPGVYMRWLRLGPEESDAAIRKQVRRFLRKHDPFSEVESLGALYAEDLLKE